MNLMPHLEYTLQGIKRAEAMSGVASRARLPITIEIMLSLRSIWSPDVSAGYEGVMLWAAACVRFFGFLRVGEFTVQSQSSYDPQVHLSLSDLSFDDHRAPTMVYLRIKQSKTDPFGQGVDVYVGATRKAVCPVDALLRYLEVHSSTAGPLFIHADGIPLTRASLVSRLKQALCQVGIQPDAFNGHSFWIGAATTAAQRGVEDSLIQTLGRWKSDTYKLYIKIPRALLAEVSRSLAC